MLLLFFLYVGTGLFLSLLAIPMLKGWLSPNPYYGFRVSATMKDPVVWDLANRFAGWRLFFAGLVIAGASSLFYFIPNQTLERYALASLAATVIALSWTMVTSFAYLWRLKPQK